MGSFFFLKKNADLCISLLRTSALLAILRASPGCWRDRKPPQGGVQMTERSAAW